MKFPNLKKQEQDMEAKHYQEEKSLGRTKVKIIIFNIINLVLLVSLGFLLQKLPRDAEKVKELRSAQVVSHSENDIGVLQAELDKNKENIESISEVFVDDEKFLGFITSIDQLEASGVISNFSLPVTKPVLDSNKNLGLPVSMTFSGSLDQVNQAFAEVDKLPYILKPVNIDIDVLPDGRRTVRFGGFLYTNENFNKN